MNTFTEKMSCLKSSHRLAGTSIYISEDVSKATQDIRMSKMEELKRKRSEGLIAYFSGIEIKTKPRMMSPNEQNSGGTGELRRIRRGQVGEDPRRAEQTPAVGEAEEDVGAVVLTDQALAAEAPRRYQGHS